MRNSSYSCLMFTKKSMWNIYLSGLFSNVFFHLQWTHNICHFTWLFTFETKICYWKPGACNICVSQFYLTSVWFSFILHCFQSILKCCSRNSAPLNLCKYPHHFHHKSSLRSQHLEKFPPMFPQVIPWVLSLLPSSLPSWSSSRLPPCQYNFYYFNFP